MRRGLGVGFVAAALILSGCTSGSSTTAPSSSAPAHTATVSTDGSTEVGIIQGTVKDDELRPVVGAAVAIVKLNVQVLTGAAGQFEFRDVPVGTHDVAAAKLGYDSRAKRVDVVAGEAATVDFILAAVEVDESFFESIPRTTLHHVGETYVTWGINLTGLSPMCDGCVFVLKPSVRKPDLVLWEVFGKHTVQNPNGGDKEHFWVFANGANGGGGSLMREAVDLKLPARFELNETHLKSLDKKTRIMWFQLLCENFWVCVEEKRESWVTFFYGAEEVPENFTAAPPG